MRCDLCMDLETNTKLLVRNNLVSGLGQTGVTILLVGHEETVALRKRDPGLVLLTDNHNVLETGGEGVAVGVVADVALLWL